MDEKTAAAMTEFTARLEEVFAGDLLAVVLYGSAAGDAYRAGVSDINVLVILQTSSAAKIFTLGRAAKSLLRKHRISPLIMTREEFAGAADVFPLEYCDILDAHTLVYGNREILDIAVSRENLRYQLEEKLRGAVGDIRAMLLAAGGNEKLLEKLLLGWSGIGGVLFRGLLRLKGKSARGMDAETVIAAAAKEYGVPPEGFSVLNSLRHSKKLKAPAASAFADMLLEPLKGLARAVDAMDGPA
ncbi:MAG: nucleotidyltransferase domain-containing protein [Spirochaetaceae bacterium]|nr:nucleotidyltransferase domain-containing protein [Spirochaetaceae bacterium]